jgi:hypothetical protein
MKKQRNCSPLDEYKSKPMLPFRGASNHANWGQSKPQLCKATKFGAVEVGIIVFSPIWPAHCGHFLYHKVESVGQPLDAREGIGNRDHFDLAMFSVSSSEPRR